MLWLIPVRSGSKRLKNKNRLPFCGLPLWLWSYATAMRVKSDGDSVVISTDDPKIFATALTLDVIASWRPSYLCGDDSPTQALIDWVFDNYQGVDSICLLQATSPTRSDNLLRRLVNHGGSVCSATNGEADGMCYIYKRGVPLMARVESCYSAIDIDHPEQFNEAEWDMKRRFE